MAILQQTDFEVDLRKTDDAERNAKLMAGIILVDTEAGQDLLAAMPSDDVERLAQALKQLLGALNLGRLQIENEGAAAWCWHLALTESGGHKGDHEGNSGKNKDSRTRENQIGEGEVREGGTENRGTADPTGGQ